MLHAHHTKSQRTFWKFSSIEQCQWTLLFFGILAQVLQSQGYFCILRRRTPRTILLQSAKSRLRVELPYGTTSYAFQSFVYLLSLLSSSLQVKHRLKSF